MARVQFEIGAQADLLTPVEHTQITTKLLYGLEAEKLRGIKFMSLPQLQGTANTWFAGGWVRVPHQHEQAIASGLDTGNSRRDAHLQARDFLDADNYPEIRFRSTKVERGKDRDDDVTIHARIVTDGADNHSMTRAVR